MGWRQSLVAVLFVVSGATSSASQGLSGLSDQQILTKLEHEWDAAFLRNDVGFVTNVLADEFIATYDDGSRGDKARELQLVTDFDQAIDSSKLHDFTIKVYGDTAVVWFSRTLAGMSKGKLIELTFRYTDVFVLKDGQWKCVSSQSTKVTSK
jgi:ketosteroid isomerase-like protein